MNERHALFIAVIALAAGCTHPQTLRFEEKNAIIGEARGQVDFRYHFQSGWDAPKPPGTLEAEDREFSTHAIGGGLQLRLHGNYSYRQVKDDDEVRVGEIAAVDGVTFTPGIVDANVRISREAFGLQFGLFTDRFLFGGGIGVFWNWFQLDGSFKSLTDRSHPYVSTHGPGFGIYLEGSPNFPPLKFYFHWNTWGAYSGSGHFEGDDTEVGIRAQFRGFMIFGGYRWEEFAGRADDNNVGESRLKFTVSGPVLGIGVSF